MTCSDFENISVSENNVRQNPEGFMQRNIKNILLVVMAINWYVLMISLVSLLKHTQVKMQFTIFIINMIEENEYCSNVMKKNVTKNL